ncbi:MAG: asparagine synthase (glutamine-hydrolyzing) [Rhizobiaceae bacterium]|nr:asparagine synthase (glutamine-hydrolyzing) [Rhizobiaceae bacterium]
MCGICGIYDLERVSDLLALTHTMADNIRHRGPDASGVWGDPSAGIALGHRRLAILDISEAGSQPMVSACGRWQIVFNGEIYNHLTLRSELEEIGQAPDWRGTSDTETLLALIATKGVIESLRRAQGMFALALWDRKETCLYLARDRMGEKPLYLAKFGEAWYFASELRALLAVPSFNPRLRPDAINAYLTYGYVPEEFCILEDVQKVPPGHIITLRLDTAAPHIAPYQTFQSLATAGLESRAFHSAGTATKRLESTLLTVVNEQMLSDVPLGCFLSGGVDSSLVAALMQSQHDTPISTFTIGFDVPRFNEAPHAAAVAEHLHTSHTEFILSEEDALAIVPQLAEIYDEPFADSSQIPMALLCREARKSVTVALSGDGGDELFGGYNRHVMGPKLLRELQRMPRMLRRPVASTIKTLAPMLIKENSLARRMVGRLKLPPTAIDRAVMLAPMLAEIEGRQDLYRHFTHIIAEPSTLSTKDAAKPVLPDLPLALTQLDAAEWMMAMDSISYLPGDILVKVDRAAMAASLETRAPFLDARVVKAAWALPKEQKIASGGGKQILRRVLDRHVPRALIDRPKQGFAVPLDYWLRNELRDWCEALIHREDLLKAVWLDHANILSLWNAHQKRHANHGQKLWTVVMLLSWVERHVAQKAAKPKHHETGLADA